MTDNERTERERVEVTQADRIAAAPMAVLAEMRDLILAGKADHYAEPFARHRIAALRPALRAQSEVEAEREAIVAFIRARWESGELVAGDELADAIEAGQHRQALDRGAK